MHFYFAWVNANETTFSPTYKRDDEDVLSFKLSQVEGEFASLIVEVRNPKVGLLSAGRKVWCWFSCDDGPMFHGRLVGIPTSIFAEVVTLEFVGRPADYPEQKESVANDLRVLPYYDPVFIDDTRLEDHDLVLEGYSRVWHIDPVTNEVSTSDILEGENTITFNASDILYESLDVQLNSVPLTQVGVDAGVKWIQKGRGQLDLKQRILQVTGGGANGIETFTPIESWPTAGAGIGDGWTVVDCNFQIVGGNPQVVSSQGGGTTKYVWPDGDETTMTTNFTTSVAQGVSGPVMDMGVVVTQNEATTNFDGTTTTSWSSSYATSHTMICGAVVKLKSFKIAYDAKRPYTERVRFILTSDVQSILTEPGEDEVKLLTFNSRDVGEEIEGEGVPIGDTSLRSYFETSRGRDSFRYLMAVARANLRMRARAVEITFTTVFDRFFDVSLLDDAVVNDTRLPGGQARGKIMGYVLSLDGDSGKVDFTVRIGCAIGRDGSVSANGGAADWVEEDWVEPDWQQYIGANETLDSDTQLDFPDIEPQDDGLNINSITADQAIESLTADNLLAQQVAAANQYLASHPPASVPASGGGYGPIGGTPQQRMAAAQAAVSARASAMTEALGANPLTITIQLKSMSAGFDSLYEIGNGVVRIPKMIDLETV